MRSVTAHCFIRNIVFNNIMLSQRESSRVYGREDCPVEHLYFKDIYAVTDEMSDPRAPVFDIKGGETVFVENVMDTSRLEKVLYGGSEEPFQFT